MTRRKAGKRNLRHRRKPEELTVAKRYTAVPTSVAAELRRATGLYGSLGRALQVATEMLIRMKKRPLPPSRARQEAIPVTFKLLPRTIDLIDQLASSVYENRQQVFVACIDVLKMTDI
jgi:hypothetical protein